MDDHALVVRVDRACEMLAVSVPKLYRLIRAGKLKSFKDGGSRKITLASICGYVEEGCAESELGRDLPKSRKK